MMKIKWLEPVGREEFESSKVFASICDRTNYRGDRTNVALYVDDKGDCKEFKFGKATWFQRSKFKDKYMGFDMMFAVKIHYGDGSWEYGFKFWREKTVNTRKHLTSLYLKDGVLDEYGSVKPDENLRPLPLWVMKMLPRYNEEVVAAVNRRDASYLKRLGMSVEDANAIWDAIACFAVASDHGEYRKDLGFATCVSHVNRKAEKYWKEIDHLWCSEYLDSQISVLSYFKSIYRQESKTVHAYGVVPISSLCSIREDRSDGEELWNNIEMTTKGIL